MRRFTFSNARPLLAFIDGLFCCKGVMLDSTAFKFNRMEIAGSLGDLGTLLPIAIGMLVINGLNPTGVFFSIGLLYILSGIYFRVTVPVQPMKVIGAYALAMAMTPHQILASGAIMGLCLLFIGSTNLITPIGKLVPQSVVRGVQLTTGILLMVQGIQFILGESKLQKLHQQAEPFIQVQHLFGVPIGIVIGIIAGILALLLLENRKFPAGLILVIGGMLLGLGMGTREGWNEFKMGLYLPDFLPLGIPSQADFTYAFFALVLPQLPMTLGNAVIANADLSKEYFKSQSDRVSYRALTISMGMANLFCFATGGMPLCHGAGGLAAHYRFGARTAGSNLFIGLIFLAMAIFFGSCSLAIIYLMPLAILGILLVFAGNQLAMTVIDVKERKDLFVVLLILGITLATDLAVGFAAGILFSYALKYHRLSV